MQALEILKLILGLETMKGKFATMDFQSANFHIIEFNKQKDCPVCGDSARLANKFEKSVSVDLITPEELRVKLGCGNPPRLLDLRYAWEHDLSRIKGDSWVDFEKLLANGPGCAKDEELVLYCKGQSKSIKAYRNLRDKGFTCVFVLKGGIDAWAEKIDRTMTKY